MRFTPVSLVPAYKMALLAVTASSPRLHAIL